MFYEVRRSQKSKNILKLRTQLKKEKSKYYVYIHYKNDKPIYVGKGTFDEKYSVDSHQRCFTSTNRKYSVKEFVDSVVIVDFYDTEQEALMVEQNITEQLKSVAHWEIYNVDSGNKFSETHKDKLSYTKKGSKHPMYGKHLSKERKAKTSKKVVSIDKNGFVKEYEGTRDVEAKEKVSHSNIVRACNGTLKTSSNRVWYYYDQIFEIYFNE